MPRAKNRVKVTVRKMDVEMRVSQLKRDIKMYEFSYETKSEEMLSLLSEGKVKETSELVKWMFDFHALQRLEGKIPTIGKPGATTVQYIKSD
jgi:hypothetical protein